MKKILNFIDKNTIIVVLIVGLISIGFISVTSTIKHDVPTDEEWEAYLAYEEELNNARDTVLAEQCTYQVQDQDTNTIIMYGTLDECKEFLYNNSDRYILMPFNPIYSMEE